MESVRIRRYYTDTDRRSAPQAGRPAAQPSRIHPIPSTSPRVVVQLTSPPRPRSAPLPSPPLASSPRGHARRQAPTCKTDVYLLPPPLHSTPCTGPSTNPRLNPRIPPNARPLLGGAPRIRHRHRLRGRFGISRAPLPLLLRWSGFDLARAHRAAASRWRWDLGIAAAAAGVCLSVCLCLGCSYVGIRP